MQDIVPDRPRIIAPPPAIYLGFLGLGLLLECLWPTRLLSWPIAAGAGSLILISGLVGLLAAIRTLWRAQTPLNPYKPTTAIVTDGPFRFSRNPIYVSNTLVFVGLSIALDACWTLALTPVLVCIVQIGVIAPEEEYLERKFGEEFLRYKRQVRRWV